MKTDRLTLLIAPADKAAIAARADELGLSVSELVRRATASYDPVEEALKVELAAVLPEAEAALGRIEGSVDRMIATLDAGERRRTHHQSSEYREQVRQELLNDPTIDWDRLGGLFWGARESAVDAA